ncbi:hypothetical protein Taro_034777 [Colocasia esculenta]|uniref:Uncharacterized protein n=1 Tax=Colocasia esculenta TaxID=4460 RepID=A0A843W1U4_COLES|nr:hypothetical protein [Colocasia esculenta]
MSIGREIKRVGFSLGRCSAFAGRASDRAGRPPSANLLVTPLPALLLPLIKRPRRTPSAAIVAGPSRTPTTPSAAIVAVPDAATIVVPAGRGRDHPRPRPPSSPSRTLTTPSSPSKHSATIVVPAGRGRDHPLPRTPPSTSPEAMPESAAVWFAACHRVEHAPPPLL